MIRNILVILTLIIHAAVPTHMIMHNHQTLQQGMTIKMKTRPIDPYDIFRGRYMVLDFENKIAVNNAADYKRAQKIFVSLMIDEEGFATLSDISIKPPSGLYLTTQVNYIHENNVYVKMPFSRYYLNEKKAPEAERIFRELSRDDQMHDSYIILKVLNGKAVTQDLIIGGKSLQAYFPKTS